MKLGLLAFLVASACSADTINFSSSTSTANNTASPTVLATVNASWAPALSSPLPSSWITTAADADPSLGTNVTFTESFMLPSDFSNAILNLGVYADDSANVMIDNTTLFTEDTTLGAHCASGPIGCTPGNEGVITNLDVTADLHSGLNTITFQDFQEVGGTPFGVDYDGSITFTSSITTDVLTPTATPEPSSLLLLSVALASLGLLKAFHKSRSAQRG